MIRDNIYDADDKESIQDKKQQLDPNEEHICKYCYFEDISENEIENLKLFPCKCTAFVHFICLKQWFQNKIIAKNNVNIATY